MRSKVIIIIRELGRVLARFNTLNHNIHDEQMINDIAAVIAKYHSQRTNLRK